MGLEILVRPLVVPDTRPSAGVALPPSSDDPVVITGNSGRYIDLHHSLSWSFTKQREREIKRRFNVLRVHNKDDDSQYVDIEAMTGLATLDPKGRTIIRTFAKPSTADNIETLEQNQVRSA